MSQFELTPEQQEVLDAADRFGRERLAPLAARMDDEEWWPEDLFVELGEAGYLGVTAPPELGGAGMDLMAQSLVLQAFARWNPAVAMSWGAHDNLCMNNILRNATDEQIARYVPGLNAGRLVGALGLTEPGAGSDALGSMATTARRDGDVYRLNGRKIYITNGPIADLLLVYAKTDPGAGAGGISAFIVEKQFEGFSVAQKLVKMGHRGSATGELVFDDCIVPAENLVGGENRGVTVVMSGLDIERAFFATHGVGIAERALELSLDYARQREQFGVRIADFQMVQSMLADMYTTIETARTMAYRAVSACNHLERGEGGRGDIHRLTAAAVYYGGRGAMQVCDQAVQIHGGMGYMWEAEVNRLFRAARLLEIGAGTSEIRKLIIAGELLR